MHIEYLYEFVELAQCLNFTEAARRCNITQPALSKHLAALEREMGATLVNRNRHGAELSQAGSALFQDAVPLCEQYRMTRKRVRTLANMPTLKIGGLLQNPRVLWTISSALSAQDGGEAISCTYDQTLQRSFMELLADENIDLAFMYQDDAQKQAAGKRFSSSPLFVDPFVAVVPAESPLADYDQLTMDDLRDQTLIKLSGPYYSLGWDHIDAVCRAHGFKPRCKGAAMQPGLDYSLVNLDGCVLVLSQSALTGQLFTRMKTHRCIPIVDDDATFSIRAVYRADNDNRALQLFLQRMKATL